MGIIDKEGNEKKLSPAELNKSSREMRGYSLISIHCAGSGHSGGTLSAMDILAAAYLNVMKHKPHNPAWEDRDRMFFSAGHKAPAWYVSLGYSGYFDIKQIATLRKLGSPFQGHPDSKKLPGIELSCGSLGQGLSAAVGSALAAKLDKKNYRVFCLMGDGEQQEGQIWEAVMSAGHYKLDNLVGIIDNNNLQIDGWTKDVMNVGPLHEKYKAFGWHVIICDGHDVKTLLEAFKEAENTKNKPAVIIANTIKGKGVSFMENQAGWHGKAPNKEQLDIAINELKLDYLPKDEMIKIAEDYQKTVDERIEKEMPKFSRNYWWNQQENMKAEMKPTRKGFGEELNDNSNPNVVALGADISGSICIDMFYAKKPDRKNRFFNMGIAEQSGTSVAAGFAKEGKIPFFGTYGVFAAGRALDQIRTTVCYGDLNVKIAGAHGGVSVGPDGATHQALEEVFQIAGLPNMNLLAGCDAVEMKKITKTAIDKIKGPCYLRFARESTPIITTEATPYEFGKATVIKYIGEKDNFIDAFETEFADASENKDEDISIISFGPEVAESMRAAWILKEEYNINARVINMSTLKPLDKNAVINAVKDTSCILTAEEHQKGGLGNLVASVIAQEGLPAVFDMIGVDDKFGESGESWELIKHFGLSAEHIAQKAKEMVDRKKYSGGTCTLS